MSLIQSDIRVEQESIYPKYVKEWADTLVQEVQTLRETLQIPQETDERIEKAYLFAARFIYDLVNAASRDAFLRIRESLLVRLQESDLTAYPKLTDKMIGRLQIFAEAIEDLRSNNPNELNEFRLALEQEPKNLTILKLIPRFDGIQRFNSEKLIKALVLLATTTPEEARYYNTELRKLRVKKYLQKYVVTEPERLVTILDVACFPEDVVDSIRLYSNSPGFNETINIFARIVGNNHYILDKVDTLATVVTNHGYGIGDVAIILSSLESIDNLFGIKGLSSEDYSRISKLVIQNLQSRGVNGTGRLSNLLALHNALRTPELNIKEISASFIYQYRMYETFEQANNFRETVVDILKKKLASRNITEKAYERIIAAIDSMIARQTLQVSAFPEQSRASMIETENPEQLAREKKLTFAEKVRIKIRDTSFQDAYASESLDTLNIDDEVIRDVSIHIFNSIENSSREYLDSDTEDASMDSIQRMIIRIYQESLVHFASRIEQKYFDAVFRVVLEIIEDGDRFYTGFPRDHARIISFDLDTYNKERIFKNKLTQESLDLFISETLNEGRAYGRVDVSNITLKYLESLGFKGDKLYRIYLNVSAGRLEEASQDLFSVFDINGESNHLYSMNKEYYSYLLLLLVNWIARVSQNPKETAKKLNILVSLRVAQYDMKTNGDNSWGEVL
jgi:hypothetical protein